MDPLQAQIIQFVRFQMHIYCGCAFLVLLTQTMTASYHVRDAITKLPTTPTPVVTNRKQSKLERLHRSQAKANLVSQLGIFCFFIPGFVVLASEMQHPETFNQAFVVYNTYIPYSCRFHIVMKISGAIDVGSAICMGEVG